MQQHHLVLGGARSGKTAFALHSAEAIGMKRVYVATAVALDSEMAERIARHKGERGAGWTTVEAALDLGAALQDIDDAEVVLVDCLTVWLSNLMHHERDLDTAWDELGKALENMTIPVILVSNEVGLSIVPENALARRFRDAQGLLNQRMAAAVERVTLVTAGLPLELKAP